MSAESPFSLLGLPDVLVRAVIDSGYETPSPIQANAIPLLLAGKDLIGQAQTGTGKTAAFALPLLAGLDVNLAAPQVLILTPTRELAIQVAEAVQHYAAHMPRVSIVPLYGGASYVHQVQQLKRGAQVLVGTPGRIMDHLRRQTLNMSKLRMLVLDEADEMLRMGFIDDVEWILGHTPASRQTVLFSATLPPAIQTVAERYLRNPEHIHMRRETATAENIRQRYWLVSGLHKLEALTRLLEIEPFEAMLIFVRTKTETLALVEKLNARGYPSEALNGDVPQAQRERVVERLKAGKIDILVATDVVARGLDVERISHVLNYDVPLDTESYIHRIGRTGRAGRKGEAILFVAHRERRMLQSIERATRSPIERMDTPSAHEVNQQRVERFKQRLQEAVNHPDLARYRGLLESIELESQLEPLELAAALAAMLHGEEGLWLEDRRPPAPETRGEATDRAPARRSAGGGANAGYAVYQMGVGREHGVKPANLMGAILNESGLTRDAVGQIDLYDDHCLVELPANLSDELRQTIGRAWVCGRRLGCTPSDAQLKPPRKRSGPPGKKPAGAGKRRPERN